MVEFEGLNLKHWTYCETEFLKMAPTKVIIGFWQLGPNAIQLFTMVTNHLIVQNLKAYLEWSHTRASDWVGSCSQIRLGWQLRIH